MSVWSLAVVDGGDCAGLCCFGFGHAPFVINWEMQTCEEILEPGSADLQTQESFRGICKCLMPNKKKA